jgi:hypothetical protein
MALGPRDLSSLVLLTGWDATELRKYSLDDGTTYDQIVSQLNTAVGAISNELANDPVWAGLISYADQPEVEYRVGASNGMSDHTEYGRADSQRAAIEGHMLPLKAYDRMLGWTWDYLRKARLSQIQADIADSIKDVRDKFRLVLLTRLLQRGDDSGTNKGLGAAGYSPGFATAHGSTNVDFVPPTVGGTSFDYDHEHYIGIGGGVFTAAVFSDAHDELREHGHEPPYEFLLGTSDEATVRGLSGFVSAPAIAAYQQYAVTANIAQLDPLADANGNYYIGVISDFRVRVVRGMPRYYGVGYKSYGPRSQRNPLRVRLNKGETTPRVLVMPDPNAGNALTPIQNLMMFLEFGVGVADRTAATPRYVNNATWADGTPT